MIDNGKYRKHASKRKLTDHEYHVQDRKYVQHKSVKMSCASTQFSTLPFCVTYEKPYVVRGLSKNHHLLLDPKLGNGKCAIRRIPCVCNKYTNILDKPWELGVEIIYQPHYQPVEDCTYWPVLSSFNNWKIIKFSNK